MSKPDQLKDGKVDARLYLGPEKNHQVSLCLNLDFGTKNTDVKTELLAAQGITIEKE
jgi:hypothetical protein